MQQPGRSPVQAGIIYREIRRLRAKYPSKPLYVVVDDMCASGGYYVAAAADKIYVDKASIVGSIGVLMDGFGFTGLMDKLGIQRRMHTSGENKGVFDPFSPETPKMDGARAGNARSDPHAVHRRGQSRGAASVSRTTGHVLRHVLDGRKERRAGPRRRFRRRRLRRARGDQAAGYRRLHAEGEHQRAGRAQVRRGGRQCRRAHADASAERCSCGEIPRFATEMPCNRRTPRTSCSWRFAFVGERLTRPAAGKSPAACANRAPASFSTPRPSA